MQDETSCKTCKILEILYFYPPKTTVMQRNLPISSIMTRKIESVGPEDKLERVRQILEQHAFHHIPVVVKGHLVGIVSYTDYLRTIREVFSDDRDQRAVSQVFDTILVKEVMTPDPLSLNPADTLETVIQIFKENRFHALPVMESDGRLVGILTTYDLMKVMEEMIAPELSYTEQA